MCFFFFGGFFCLGVDIFIFVCFFISRFCVVFVCQGREEFWEREMDERTSWVSLKDESRWEKEKTLWERRNSSFIVKFIKREGFKERACSRCLAADPSNPI